MVEHSELIQEKNNRRSLGIHLTSTDTFLKYIFPEIKLVLDKFLWVDLYAGEGNLILPILNHINEKEKVEFFKNHIYLFDIQEEMYEKCINNALSYNIPIEIAQKNMFVRDNLESFPKFLKSKRFPIFHVTNPPYLYLGYIRKHEETKTHLKYFEKKNEGYQDLYQIAMINDLRNEIEDLIYIIPSNFIFGYAVSNKFRNDFLKYYYIDKMYIFETKIFEYTGTNIVIGFFKRKKYPKVEIQKFTGIKFKQNNKTIKREYTLNPKYNYRGGSEFDDFCINFKSRKPLKVKYYIQREDVKINSGNCEVEVIDTSNYISNEYSRTILHVDDIFAKFIKSNILYVRTVDTGSYEGRAGLYIIKDDYHVDGIYVSGNTYRTSPIHVFIEPTLSKEDQFILKDYFNFILEHFRSKLDSEFLTTYKYSEAEYTRKYLGLTQVRKIIETFPTLTLDGELKLKMRNYIELNKFEDLLKILKNHSNIILKKNTDITNWF